MRFGSPRLSQIACLVFSALFFSAVAQASLPNASENKKTNVAGEQQTTNAAGSEENLSPAVLPEDGKVVLGPGDNEFFIIAPSSPKKLRLAAEEAERQLIKLEAAKEISLAPHEIAKKVTYIHPEKNVHRLVHSANKRAKKESGIAGPLSALSNPFLPLYPEDIGVKPSAPLFAYLNLKPQMLKGKPILVAKPKGRKQFNAHLGKKKVIKHASNKKNVKANAQHSKKRDDKKRLQTSLKVKKKHLPSLQRPHEDSLQNKLADKVKWRRDVRHGMNLPNSSHPLMPITAHQAEQLKGKKHPLIHKKASKTAKVKAGQSERTLASKKAAKQHKAKKPFSAKIEQHQKLAKKHLKKAAPALHKKQSAKKLASHSAKKSLKVSKKAEHKKLVDKKVKNVTAAKKHEKRLVNNKKHSVSKVQHGKNSKQKLAANKKHSVKTPIKTKKQTAKKVAHKNVKATKLPKKADRKDLAATLKGQVEKTANKKQAAKKVKQPQKRAAAAKVAHPRRMISGVQVLTPAEVKMLTLPRSHS